ncbi:MAG: thymidine phosphorylase [Treponema sp.]|nr:MAG: thymidine phosphorylase [Treponema sp.]
MRAVDIIMKKRGFKTMPPQELSRDEIEFLINSYVKGEIPDYQVSAWLMAVFFNGMSFEETAVLTEVMLNSGSRIDLSSVTGVFVDKHSTGGVGDKISIPLAPIVASCGVKVPMMSGRALGHTGGTLDKLESITGYKTGLTPSVFADGIAKNGYAMTGQTEEIVPADRLLYALRDVTGTVESVPLITASILSKKIAEGSDALVFDVKCGAGAFMKTIDEAEELAKSLVGTGVAMGKKVVALITDMSEPLGLNVGNFLEIEESMAVLEGNGPSDVTELTLQLASWMIMLGEKASSKEEALEKAKDAIASGLAMECFLKNVEMQGGDVKKLLNDRGSRRSRFKTEIKAKQSGIISGIDAMKVGLAGVYLGVGRNKTTDSVCSDAGVIFKNKTGADISAGDVIMEVYGKDEASLDMAVPLLQDSVQYGEQGAKNSGKNLIYKEIKSGV